MRVQKGNHTHFGKRALALFLSMVMCMSMLQLTAFAADSSQIMTGNYEIGEGNVIATDESGEAAKIVPDTVTEDGFTLTKRVAAASGDNEFNVTLQVVTQQVVTTKDAAVMIVIDNSGSMRYCAKCGKETDSSTLGSHNVPGTKTKCDSTTNRMTATINALKKDGGFIDTLVSNNQKNNGGKIYVSVVKFDTTAKTICDWTDITSGTGAATVKNTINGDKLNASGGTNLEAGLLLAKNRLGMSAISGVAAENKYTVLLTDGAPTYRVSNNSKATSTEEAGTGSTGGTSGEGSSTSADDRNQAKDVATEVKALSKLYTICYGVSGDTLYESTEDKCANCGKTEAEHVELCSNCGKAKSEHKKGDVTGTWYCYKKLDISNTYTGSLYCDSNRTNQYEATTVTVTIGDYLKNEIATPATADVTYAFNAGNDTDINNAFASISSSSTSGMTGGGTAVTDPMGEFIVLGSVDALAAKGVTETADGIVWALNPDNARKSTEGGVTTYTYTITYPITLNTSDEDFVEGVYYPTNGYTYLSVPQEDGSVKQLAFTVPGVKGEIPEYKYTVKFFKQGDAEPGDYASYTEVTGDTATRGPVDLHTPVSAAEVSTNYQTKYNGDNYHYVYGAPVSMKVTADESQNVIKLYYNKDTTSVTVNHYYKTNTWSAAGVYTEGTYSAPMPVSDTGYVGEKYEAKEETKVGSAEYKYVSGTKTIASLSANGADNVLNLYYERTVDERADASVRVDHVYRTHSWVLENGTYKQKTTSITETGVEVADGLKATTVYTAGTAPKSGYSSFIYDTSSVNSITLQPGENVITLNFDYYEDEPDRVTITVNHHYTKTVTSYVDGVAQTKTVVDDHVETETVTIHKGEDKTLTEQNVYDEETYVSAANNADKLALTSVQSNTTVDLYYRLDEMPDKTSATVKHIYRTITHETVEVWDEAHENVIGKEVVDHVNIDDEVSATTDNLYVGQSFQAVKAGREGYTFNETKSDALTTTVKANGATLIELYYDRDAYEDNRDAATIDVQHVYVTHLETIRNGVETTVDVEDYRTTEDTVTLRSGDTFTAVPKTTYEGNEGKEYSVVGEPVLTKVLHAGTNDTIVINYERDGSDRVPVNYQVNYEYKTYQMFVDTDGVAKYPEQPDDVKKENDTGSGYVGQYINIQGKPEDGFTLAGTAPGSRQTLAASGNEWTYTYVKYVPLDQVSVTVNHYYTKTTIAVDGTSSSVTTPVAGTPVMKYVGETYVAKAVPNSYTYDHYTITEGIAATQNEVTKDVTLTASGNVVVNFYYTDVENNSKPVDYSIQHIYRIIDWDGSVSESSPDPITGRSFATKQLSAATSIPTNYSLVSATFNGATIEGFDPDDPQDTYTVTLVDGTNEIVYIYEYQTDSRVDEGVSVTVRHNYFARDTYKVDASLTNEAYISAEGVVPEYTVEQVVTGKNNGIWIGAEFIAEKQLTYTVGEGADAQTLEYTFVNADPESMKVELTEAGEYKITINYIREYSTDPGDAQYTVTHEYYTNGSLDGSTSAEATAKVGDTVNAADITKVTTYGGNSYNYTSATPDSITVATDGSSVITLRYDRTVTNHRDDDDDRPVKPPVVIVDPEVPLTPMPEEPEVEIPEEEVPLAEAPETGDVSALWLALTALSGTGLAGLAVLGRKKREDEE